MWTLRSLPFWQNWCVYLWLMHFMRSNTLKQHFKLIFHIFLLWNTFEIEREDIMGLLDHRSSSLVRFWLLSFIFLWFSCLSRGTKLLCTRGWCSFLSNYAFIHSCLYMNRYFCLFVSSSSLSKSNWAWILSLFLHIRKIGEIRNIGETEYIILHVRDNGIN